MLSQIKKIPNWMDQNKYSLIFCISTITLLYGISPEFRFDLLLENPNYNPEFLLPTYVIAITGFTSLFTFSMLMPRCG